ncbi:unnamed protein product, partial [Prorocentrum cordatum]
PFRLGSCGAGRSLRLLGAGADTARAVCSARCWEAMPKKRKKPPQEEGPPDVSQEQLAQVLEAKSTKAVDKSVNVAKLTLELLEASTTQLVRRMGWFRDVRLRRSGAPAQSLRRRSTVLAAGSPLQRLADSFMRSSKMHQQASSRENWETDRGMAKPSPQELAEYEEALKQHVLQAQSKFPGGADERQARDQRQGRRAWEGGRHQASRAEVPREGAGETAQVRHQGHDRGEEAEGQGGPEAEGQGRRRRPVSCTGFGGFAGCLSSSASSSFHPPPS